MGNGLGAVSSNPTTNWRVMALGCLAMLFLSRVLVQLVQWVGDVRWLPAFERWQSGALPYWALLLSQVLILLLLAFVLVGVKANRSRLGERSLTAVQVFGILYGTLMILRLVAGLTFADGHQWLDNPLPSVFHIVLAMFVLTWADFERRIT